MKNKVLQSTHVLSLVMIPPSCYCGIPLQRAAKYVSISELILGVLGSIVYSYLVANLNSVNKSLILTEEEFKSQIGSEPGTIPKKFTFQTYSGVYLIPKGVYITILICHVIQVLIGIVLYFGAVKKNRTICMVWMAVAALTVLLIIPVIRIYWMLVVYEFMRELKMEQEVTEFPGNHSNSGQFGQHPKEMQNQQNSCNPYTYSQYPIAPGPQVPVALQPPNYFEVANGSGNANGNGDSKSTGYTYSKF